MLFVLNQLKKMNFMKTNFLILFLVYQWIGFSQEKDTLKTYISKTVEVVDKDFQNKYRYYKPIVVKVYPYALYAADLLDEMNNDLASIQKRRKQNKFLKESYQNLKSDFKYVLLDMYTTEGQVLMKLISRETGMTVYEIINQYRGRKDAAMFNLMGKMFDQDIKSEYNSKKEYVLETIIKDINSGKINFKNEVELLDKAEYKEKKKATKERIKADKKKKKANKKLRKKKKKMPKYKKPI